MRRRASRWPSKVAQRVGVIPSSSFELQSFLVASFSMSNFPSRAALISGERRRFPIWTSSRLIFWLIDSEKQNQDRTFRSDSIIAPSHFSYTRNYFDQSNDNTTSSFLYQKRNGARRRHCHDNKCGDNRWTLITTEMTPMSHPSGKFTMAQILIYITRLFRR